MCEKILSLAVKMKKSFLSTLLRLNKSVFSFNELILLYGQSMSIKALVSKLSYYVKKGELYHIRRGLYAKNSNYDRLELATKILIPSYISFETVLLKAGIIFQYYSQIFVASYESKQLMVDGQQYIFRRIKDPILTASVGIDNKENYSIASPERAFLDILYLHKDYYFDNLLPLHWDKVYEILPIYNKKRVHKLVDYYYKLAKEK